MKAYRNEESPVKMGLATTFNREVRERASRPTDTD